MNWSYKMLSIVIPTKNEQYFLPNLLYSIFSQNYTQFEVVVSDCNSTDETLNIAESYEYQTVIGSNSTSEAMNKGAKLSCATYPYLLFLDADIVLPDNDFLDNMMEYVIQNNIKMGTCAIKQTKHSIEADIWSAFRYHIPTLTGAFILIEKNIYFNTGGMPEGINFDAKYSIFLRKRGYKIRNMPFFVYHTRYMSEPYKHFRNLPIKDLFTI